MTCFPDDTISAAIFRSERIDFSRTATFCYGTWEQKAPPNGRLALEERFYEEMNAG
jgi:hypothetical protein